MPRRSIFILVLFAVLLGLASFPNHRTFRTYALDLGLYTHAAYDYAHGEVDDGGMFLERPSSILADHFDLHLALWGPLTYVFGSWTLLLVQWLAIILGAVGTYRLVLKLFSGQAAWWALLVFITSWGVYTAVCFDFHSSVVAAMAVPWLFLAALERKGAFFWAALTFILAAKENEGFWLAFLCIGAWLLLRQLGHSRRMLLLASPIAMAISILITGVIMPALSHEGAYVHFDYGILGNGLTEALQTTVTKPGQVFLALFQVDGDWSAVKLEFFAVFALAGGWMCLANPRYLLMLIPLFLFKMLNDKEQLWGLNAHYSVEFIPVIALAAGHMFHRIPQRWFGVLIVLASVGGTIHVLDGSLQFQERGRSRFYQAKHYERPWSLTESYEALALIPDEAPVSAQSPYVPHLALRRAIYQFPIKQDAEYILLNPLDEPYPLSENDFNAQLDALKNDPDWALIYSSNSALVFRRAY